MHSDLSSGFTLLSCSSGPGDPERDETSTVARDIWRYPARTAGFPSVSVSPLNRPQDTQQQREARNREQREKKEKCHFSLWSCQKKRSDNASLYWYQGTPRVQSPSSTCGGNHNHEKTQFEDHRWGYGSWMKLSGSCFPTVIYLCYKIML